MIGLSNFAAVNDPAGFIADRERKVRYTSNNIAEPAMGPYRSNTLKVNFLLMYANNIRAIAELIKKSLVPWRRLMALMPLMIRNARRPYFELLKRGKSAARIIASEQNVEKDQSPPIMLPESKAYS
jgi:hypothetical protein